MLCHYRSCSALILALGHADVSAARLENLQAQFTCTVKALSESNEHFLVRGTKGFPAYHAVQEQK